MTTTSANLVALKMAQAVTASGLGRGETSVNVTQISDRLGDGTIGTFGLNVQFGEKDPIQMYSVKVEAVT